MPLFSVRECIFAPFEVGFLAEFALEFAEFAAKFTKFCEFLLKFAEFALKFVAKFEFKFAAFNNDGNATTAPNAVPIFAEFLMNFRRV